jgi:hypothetical protein
VTAAAESVALTLLENLLDADDQKSGRWDTDELRISQSMSTLQVQLHSATVHRKGIYHLAAEFVAQPLLDSLLNLTFKSAVRRD